MKRPLKLLLFGSDALPLLDGQAEATLDVPLRKVREEPVPVHFIARSGLEQLGDDDVCDGVVFCWDDRRKDRKEGERQLDGLRDWAERQVPQAVKVLWMLHRPFWKIWGVDPAWLRGFKLAFDPGNGNGELATVVRHIHLRRPSPPPDPARLFDRLRGMDSGMQHAALEAIRFKLLGLSGVPTPDADLYLPSVIALLEPPQLEVTAELLGLLRELAEAARNHGSAVAQSLQSRAGIAYFQLLASNPDAAVARSAQALLHVLTQPSR